MTLHLTSCTSDFPATPSEARELARLLEGFTERNNGGKTSDAFVTMSIKSAAVCAAALRRFAGERG
jgi:hypothetical protein